MNLCQLGWNDFFDTGFAPHRIRNLKPARVARRDKLSWLVYTELGELTAGISGRLRSEIADSGGWPTVGDWVAVAVRPGEGAATIQATLPRKNSFTRKAASSGGMPDSGGRTDEQVLAANIDTLFLVSALDGDFNVRRVERYLLAAYDCAARPVIVLNKADLCDNTESRLVELESVAYGADICIVSATAGDGMESLSPFLVEGSTVALLGSSGVGKSTIINQLLGAERQTTAAVRESDSRGRHTTTSRELIIMPNGGILIDSPGIRELQLWSTETSLARAFDDIESFAGHCRFRDCRHHGEPGCAVEAAIRAGDLDEKRFQSYRKLQKELQRLERRQSGLERHLERLRGKRFAGVVKEAVKLKMRRR